MNIEKLKRLQSQVRIGGKGTPRRKKKVMHQTAAADDKKLQGSLKKLSVSTIPGIEEVNIIKDDLTVIHFNNPKAQASLSANTFAVTGHGETKKIVEMLPEILPQLGQETVVQLRMFANSMTKNQKEGMDGFEPNLLRSTDEDDVPLLVSDFDEIAKKEDQSKGQLQRQTKGSVLNVEIDTTREGTDIQESTGKCSNSGNKPIDNAIAGSLIAPTQTPENNVETEEDVKKDNVKKPEIRNQGDSTRKTVKDSNVKKEHNKPKSKVTDTQPSPQLKKSGSITESVQDSKLKEKKGTNVKETVKKNTTKTTEKSNAGANITDIYDKKESNKPTNKVTDEAPNTSELITTDILTKPLRTPENYVKIKVDDEEDTSKKSEKKQTEEGNADDNVIKQPIKLEHKVSEAVTFSISQQQNDNERNKLLPTKELKQDVIKSSDEYLNTNVVPSSKISANLENTVTVTELKGDLMTSNAQSNKNQVEQAKHEFIDQSNLIASHLIDNPLSTDSNVEALEISNNDIQQENTNVAILSLERDKGDSYVADASNASSGGIVDQLNVTSLDKELKKENTQEMQNVLNSIKAVENTIKNVEELEDGVEPVIALLNFESLERKIDIDEKKCEIIPNVAITKEGDVHGVSILKLETIVKDVQVLKDIPNDAKTCLEEGKEPKNFAKLKDAVEPAIALLSLENLDEKRDLDEKQCETTPNMAIAKESDVQEVDDISILKLETLVKDVEVLQLVSEVITSDAQTCLEVENKPDEPKLFDKTIVTTDLLDSQQTKETQIEKLMATNLIDIEKQIKDLELTQDVAFVQEKLLERKPNEKVLEKLQNIKTHPDDIEISKDLIKTVEEHNILKTKTKPEELAKQTIDDNIKPQINIDANLIAKSNRRSPSQKKDSPQKKDTGKPQLAPPIKHDPKKSDPSVRPKQVSVPKSSPTGTTPKHQQSSKSVTGSTSVKQEKSSVASKPRQTLSTSIKSQATATASKPLTTQPKKLSVSPTLLDPATKNSVTIKASSAPETTQATASPKPRAGNNNQKGTKKPKPQSVATTVQQKVAEDPPKSSP